MLLILILFTNLPIVIFNNEVKCKNEPQGHDFASNEAINQLIILIILFSWKIGCLIGFLMENSFSDSDGPGNLPLL